MQSVILQHKNRIKIRFWHILVKKHAYKEVLSFYKKTFIKKNMAQLQNAKWKIRIVKVWYTAGLVGTLLLIS